MQLAGESLAPLAVDGVDGFDGADDIAVEVEFFQQEAAAEQSRNPAAVHALPDEEGCRCGGEAEGNEAGAGLAEVALAETGNEREPHGRCLALGFRRFSEELFDGIGIDARALESGFPGLVVASGRRQQDGILRRVFTGRAAFFQQAQGRGFLPGGEGIGGLAAENFPPLRLVQQIKLDPLQRSERFFRQAGFGIARRLGLEGGASLLRTVCLPDRPLERERPFLRRLSLSGKDSAEEYADDTG